MSNMNRNMRGFTLIQLLIAMVLSAILMVFVYRSMIKGIGTMTDSTKTSILMRQATIAINSIGRDLKLVGYNPSEFLNSAGNPLFRITDHPANNDSIVYSVYNDGCPITDPTLPLPSDPTCASAVNGIDGDDLVTDACYCERFFVDAGTVKKQFWNRVLDTNGNVVTDQPEEMGIINNACLRIILWDSAADRQCVCQSGFDFRKCPDSDGDDACTVADNNDPSGVVKIILAVVPSNKYTDQSDFNSDCTHKTLQKNEYIRIEKKIRFSNIF